jgi:hypothetical protein
MPRHPDDNQHPHLQLEREGISPESRKRAGFPGPRPDRGGRAAFAARIERATSRLIEEQRGKPRIAGIKPHLVFHVPLIQNANIKEVSQLFEKAGFMVVSIEPQRPEDGVERERAIVAFKEDDDLKAF